jgi:hypothetical protein
VAWGLLCPRGMKKLRLLWILLLGCGPSEPIAVTTEGLHDGTIGAGYWQIIGYSGPGSVLSARDLPPGLRVPKSDLDVITGLPTEAGDFNPTIIVRNDKGESDSKVLPLKIYPALSITTQSLPAGQVGVPYSATVETQGGKPLLRYESTGGLAPGLRLDLYTGVISGTPTQSCSAFVMGFKVVDANEAEVVEWLTIEIAP